jgi:Tol biopolymer transport system component
VSRVARHLRDSIRVNLRAAAALTAVLAGCSGGSSAPTLQGFVTAPRVEAELALAHPGDGFRLVGGDGRILGTVRLPGGLQGGDSPAWSPDGTALAFAANTPAHSDGPLLPPTDVYVTELKSGTTHRATTGRSALYPQWSPDGRWIAYSAVTVADKKRTAAIWVVHPDGTGARELTPARADSYDLAGPFNPRTGRIAFTRCRRPVLLRNGMEPDTCAVWTMTPAAGSQRRLATESEQPAWSPDGRRIVFASARDHAARIRVGEDESSWIRQIYVMNADGTAQHRLLATATSDRWPTWAPGGAVIAFETTSRTTSQTTADVVNADGSCRRTVSPRLTGRLDVGYHSPAWRPGGAAARLVC